jgi:hypothetical protein
MGVAAPLPWWFDFVVLTVAAERLELARLMRDRPAARALLRGIVWALVAGSALASAAGVAAASAPALAMTGGVVYGAALLALAAWLLQVDIARRTVRADGLARYMAVCLLAGYAWLAVAGLAWAATALGAPLRDAALHALGLGFIGSMIFGHAPVILPAVARVKLRFSAAFYVPLALLHATLLVRVLPGTWSPGWRAAGAALNVVALVAFVLTVLHAAWRARTRAPAGLAPEAMRRS